MAISSAERAAAAPRVLCLAPNWLGDAILARPALAWLGGRGYDLELWARDGLGRVLEDLPGVRRIHPSRATSRLARLREVGRLRPRGYGAALVLPPSFAAALAACCSGARARIGYATDARAWLLSQALPAPARDTHLATQYLRLAQALAVTQGESCDAPAALPPTMPPLVATSVECQAAWRLLEPFVGREPFLVVAPGARYGPAKQYPPDRFAAAAAALAQRFGWCIVLVGAAADAAQTAAVQALLPAAVDLAGRTSLQALVGLLAESRGVLANDSGTMHLAAALGRPVVGVFGSTNPHWTAPLGSRAAALAEPVWCAPCYAPTCKQDFGCMLGIPAERLAAALVERLESPPSASPSGPRV